MSLEHEERTGKMICAALYENALAIEQRVQGVPFQAWHDLELFQVDVGGQEGNETPWPSE